MKIIYLIEFFLLQFITTKEILKKIDRNLSSEPAESEFAVQRSNPNNPKNLTNCNKKMLNSYGLTGNSSAQETTHKYCPMINKNCCNPKDETLTMHMWNSNSKYGIEKYYEMYLFSLKYLLGFSDEGFNLANDFAQSKNSVCREAADEFVNLKIDNNVALEMYRNFEYSLEKIGDLRRGFYCILCDAKTHNDLKEFWNTPNEKYRNRLYFSQDYCKKLVTDTIKTSYYTVNYLKKFLESLSTLVSCKANNTTQLEFPVSHEEKLKVRNCFFFREKYFFFFCEKYCESLEITKPSPIFDGNLKALRNFVNHIALYRKEVFYYPSRNNFIKDISHIEGFLKNNFKDAIETDIFIRSTNNNLTFDKMKTDVVYHGGIEPFDSVENSLYQIVLSGVDVFKVLGGLVLALMV